MLDLPVHYAGFAQLFPPGFSDAGVEADAQLNLDQLSNGLADLSVLREQIHEVSNPHSVLLECLHPPFTPHTVSVGNASQLGVHEWRERASRTPRAQIQRAPPQQPRKGPQLPSLATSRRPSSRRCRQSEFDCFESSERGEFSERGESAERWESSERGESSESWESSERCESADFLCDAPRPC